MPAASRSCAGSPSSRSSFRSAPAATAPPTCVRREVRTAAVQKAGLMLIRHQPVSPIAGGEIYNSTSVCREPIQDQLSDYSRTPVVQAGVTTQLRMSDGLAEVFEGGNGSHTANDLSPVCMSAALNSDL